MTTENKDVTISSARLEALHKVVKAATLLCDTYQFDRPTSYLYQLKDALKGLEDGRGN